MEAGYWTPGTGGVITPSANIGRIMFPPVTITTRASGFVLFDPVPVAQAQVITSATINIANNSGGIPSFLFNPGTGPPAGGTYAARGDIFGNDVDDATVPFDALDADSKARTTASTVFVEDGTLVGNTFTPNKPAPANASYDVTAIVQEIVNRPLWASGNAMQFFFDESGSDFADLPAPSYYGTWVTFDPTLTLTIT